MAFSRGRSRRARLYGLCSVDGDAMRRQTKARLSTVIGVALSAVTFTGPLGGDILAKWQCKRGLCPHSFHRHRYRGPS